MQQLKIVVVSDCAYMFLCLCLQSGSSAENWTSLSATQTGQRDAHPKSVGSWSTGGHQSTQDPWGWRALLCLPAPKHHSSSTGLCAAGQWGMELDAARQDVNYWWISSKLGSPQLRGLVLGAQMMELTLWQKTLWAKRHIWQQQTLPLHLMWNLSYIQRSKYIPEIHTLRTAWQNVVLPNHKSAFPNVTKLDKMELTATWGKSNPTHKIQHRGEI